jgi:hypothetical protein
MPLLVAYRGYCVYSSTASCLGRVEDSATARVIFTAPPRKHKRQLLRQSTDNPITDLAQPSLLKVIGEVRIALWEKWDGNMPPHGYCCHIHYIFVGP